MNQVIVCGGGDAIQAFLRWFKKEVITLFYKETIDRDLAEFVVLELLNNGYEHGNKKDKTKGMTVVWKISSHELQVSIEDEGSGFVPSIPKSVPPLSSPRGRGLWAIQTEELVKSFIFSNGGRKVTITLVSPRSVES